MALLDLLRRERPTQTTAPAVEFRSLAEPSPFLLDLFGAVPVLSGVSVTPANAMSCTAVRSAVEAIAETVGTLPLFLYRRAAQDARERASEHPAYALLHDQANDWTSAQAFREQITRDALLHGNGFAFVHRVAGEPRELLRLAPATITVKIDKLTGEPIYEATQAQGGPRYLDRRDVLHIPAPSIDGVSGASPVMQCREAIGLAVTLERHAARLFGRGSRPSGVLSFPKVLQAEGIKKIKESWTAAHSGENSGGVAVLDEGAAWQSITLNSVDSQFLQIWQHAITEICRVFRVPPHMVFELDRATWGNAAEMGASFLRFTLMRWLKTWENEARLKLIEPADRATHYAEFLVDDLLRSDIGARATAYSTLIAARVLNPNEARAMENRPPYAGGEIFANPNTSTTGKAEAANA